MDDLGKTKVKTAPTLNVDWEVYAQSLENSGMSEQEKQEYIEIIWSIVVGFVDMGFGLHSVQQIKQRSHLKSDFNDAVIQQPKGKRRNACKLDLKK